MTPIQLQNIIKQGESETVEFKTTFNNEALITINAFANTKGGRIFIGVNDRNEIIGTDINKESVQNWMNEIKTKTEPSIIPDTQTINIHKKTIIIIRVQEYPVKPIALKGRYYCRKQNSNHLLDINEINNLYLSSLQVSWDSLPDHKAHYNDLDKNKITAFIDQVKSNKRFNISNKPVEALLKLRLLNKDIPSNAAILLFSKELSLNNIHIGRFKTPSLIIAEKMIRGTLFDVLEESMQFIISQLKVAFEITGSSTKRNEIFEYPLPAIRELLLNAIVHRDYRNPSDIQIKIFDQSISFYNPGKLFGELTIKDLKKDNYQAHTRNKLIAESFYLVNEIEKYGSGYVRIRELIRNYPGMKFDFEEKGDGFHVVLSYQQQKISLVNGGLNGGLNEKQEKVLKYIIQNPNSKVKDMSVALSIPIGTMEKYIRFLVKTSLIERRGSKKTGGYYKI